MDQAKEYKQIKILIDPKSIQYPQTNGDSTPSKQFTSNNSASSSTHPSHASQNNSEFLIKPILESTSFIYLLILIYILLQI